MLFVMYGDLSAFWCDGCVAGLVRFGGFLVILVLGLRWCCLVLV